MEEDNKKVEENVLSVKKSKSNKLLLIVVIICMLLIFGLGLYLGLKICENKGCNCESKTKTPTNSDNKLIIDNNIKNKLNEYIKLNYIQGIVSDSIINGTNELSKSAKEMITYNSVSNQMIKLNKDQIPEKHRNNDYWMSDGVTIYQLSLNTYESEYKRIFNEEYTFDSENHVIEGCPMVFNIDKELGYMFLSNQCGNTGLSGYLYLNYKYESDNDYYYVYQYIVYQQEGNKPGTIEYIKPKSKEKVDVDSFNGNESKFETLIWKFDKNLLFVSTENIG